ncbi:hypothetical protein F5B22DRAFT_149775 [Xylaria bambusicola]|uniref:uncharacterized protein n=1 Tax=Xylaria bambusicola TaxID=326684 RepID=UPI002008DAE7|nr:uncharacterized protein F5B22DRAFT_149775 [Xylaria bambusicola]KAI0526263.1 hypothetical protein F5B22DRAFT_149775 [Xylaria bambusicola]
MGIQRSLCAKSGHRIGRIHLTISMATLDTCTQLCGGEVGVWHDNRSRCSRHFTSDPHLLRVWIGGQRSCIQHSRHDAHLYKTPDHARMFSHTGKLCSTIVFFTLTRDLSCSAFDLIESIALLETDCWAKISALSIFAYLHTICRCTFEPLHLSPGLIVANRVHILDRKSIFIIPPGTGIIVSMPHSCVLSRRERSCRFVQARRALTEQSNIQRLEGPCFRRTRRSSQSAVVIQTGYFPVAQDNHAKNIRRCDPHPYE